MMIHFLHREKAVNQRADGWGRKHFINYSATILAEVAYFYASLICTNMCSFSPPLRRSAAQQIHYNLDQ